MNLMSTPIALLVILALVASSLSWPIKPDDKEQRIREAEEIAAKDLDAFREAWDQKDFHSLANYTGDCLTAVREADNNNKRLVKGLGFIVNALSKLTEAKGWKFARMRKLQFLTNAADGNRDNLSYYRLEAARMWIERRSFAEVPELTEAMVAVTAARDALENMASTLVAAIKTIKAETKKIFKEDDELIRETGRKVVAVVEQNRQPLLDQAAKAIQILQHVIDKWSRDSPSTSTEARE